MKHRTAVINQIGLLPSMGWSLHIPEGPASRPVLDDAASGLTALPETFSSCGNCSSARIGGATWRVRRSGLPTGAVRWRYGPALVATVGGPLSTAGILGQPSAVWALKRRKGTNVAWPCQQNARVIWALLAHDDVYRPPAWCRRGQVPKTSRITKIHTEECSAEHP